jgi:transposase
MPQIDTIRNLHKSGHSNREISRLTGVHRDTVAKYLAEDTPENGDLADSKPAKPDHRGGPKNTCEPFRDLILKKLDAGLDGTRIHQDLVDEHGFQASYSSVRRFIQGARKTSKLPFRRIETPPGEEAQVDFGTAAPIKTSDGKTRRPWVLRVVLSHSRKAYSQVVYRQTTDDFLDCLENAFHHFGGVPKHTVIDNLKAAVSKADWYDPLLHPKIQSFANHYGTAILPTKPYTPRHKGKVENGIKYVKSNALKGRTFTSLNEQNNFLLDWEKRVADTRIHGTVKKQVSQLFEAERPALLELPPDRFPNFHESKRTVHRDGHVAIDKAFYSAPPEYVGRIVWVRWDSRLVRLFNDRFEKLIVHAKVEAGKFQTANEHIPFQKVSAVERGTDSLLSQVARIGPHTRKWSHAMTNARGVAAVRVLLGLKSLTHDHSDQAIEKACESALSYGAYRLQTIRQLLKRYGPEQKEFEFLEEHPIIRPLKDYSIDSILEFRKEKTV